MTEATSTNNPAIADPASFAGLVDASLQPGGAISLTFSDGVLNITLDQSGDWTIAVGLSLLSRRLEHLTKSLADLGFFHATEQGGMIYHLWTSALHEDRDDRDSAELTLLKVLMTFHNPPASAYIA
jgi:hypothetical protein